MMQKTGELKVDSSRCSSCGKLATTIHDDTPLCDNCLSKEGVKEAAEDALADRMAGYPDELDEQD